MYSSHSLIAKSASQFALGSLVEMTFDSGISQILTREVGNGFSSFHLRPRKQLVLPNVACSTQSKFNFAAAGDVDTSHSSRDFSAVVDVDVDDASASVVVLLVVVVELLKILVDDSGDDDDGKFRRMIRVLRLVVAVTPTRKAVRGDDGWWKQ